MEACDLETAVDDGEFAVDVGEAFVLHPEGEEVAVFEVVQFSGGFRVREGVGRDRLRFLPVFRSEVDEDARLDAFDGFVGSHFDAEGFLVVDGEDFDGDREVVSFEGDELALVEFGSEGSFLDCVLFESVLFLFF